MTSPPTRRVLVLAIGIAAGACANIETPPGGPVDNTPPILLTTVPESLGVYPDFDDDVEFIFSEVVSEGSSANLGIGSGTLEQLLILSPTEEVPRIGWRRNRVTLKPREGWSPNRVYRVELLPGVTDIERNRSNTGTILTFTTGSPLPTDTLRGQVFDWTQGRPLTRGLILATLLPDSLTYRTVADSTGRFAFGPLPTGAYLVTGVIDGNTNLRLDQREAFDSVSVAAGDLDVGALWTFPHDTIGPRVQAVAVVDSVTLAISFNQFLDPTQRFDTSGVRLVSLPDSLPIDVLSLLPQALHDSLYPRLSPIDTSAVDSLAVDSLVEADSTLADSLEVADSLVVDSLVGPPGAIAGPDSATQALLDSRPRLFDRLTLRVASPLVAEGRYFFEMGGLRNVNGAVGEQSGAGLVVPAPPPLLPEPEPGDSLAAPADSLAIPADSLAAPPAEGGDDEAPAP